MEKTISITYNEQEFQALIIDCVNACLKHTAKDTGTHPEGDQLLNITQAAELLNLSVATLYTKVHKAELPVCKRSHRLYFSKKDLMEYIKAGRKKTGAELAAEAEQYVNNKKKGGRYE